MKRPLVFATVLAVATAALLWHVVAAPFVVPASSGGAGGGGGLTTNSGQFLGVPLALKAGAPATNLALYGGSTNLGSTYFSSIGGTANFSMNYTEAGVNFWDIFDNSSSIRMLELQNDGDIFLRGDVTIDVGEKMGALTLPGVEITNGFIRLTGNSVTPALPRGRLIITNASENVKIEYGLNRIVCNLSLATGFGINWGNDTPEAYGTNILFIIPTSFRPAITNSMDLGHVNTPWKTIYGQDAVLNNSLSLVPTNNNPVLSRAANSNAIPVTNIVGLVELAAGTPTFLNANVAQQYVQTNRVTAATTFVYTNTSVGQEFSLVVPGEASGGTSRVITLAAGTGSAASLIANLDVFGTALAFTMTFTLTNGNAAEINGKVTRVHIAGAGPTNVVSFVTRQYAF